MQKERKQETKEQPQNARHLGQVERMVMRVAHFDGGVPLALLNEEWAMNNHGQTLTRLSERGGLSACEALAIIDKRKWRRMVEEGAIKTLREVVSDFDA